MAGKYIVDGNVDINRKGKLLSMWSVNKNSTEAQKNAAIRIIYYFLSDSAQEIYTVEYSQGLPLNKNVWKVYEEVNPDFGFIDEQAEALDFE